VDLLFTGELSHHEVLASVAKGQHVILCGHTNTERGYLNILRQKLQADLDKEVGPETTQVLVSAKDHDPVEIVT
jgi:putative NIF3 family GTP cyclohydrolase 1 type 2